MRWARVAASLCFIFAAGASEPAVQGPDAQPSLPPSATATFSMSVKSAGWHSGNSLDFYVDGQKLDVAVKRGIDVAALNADGTLGAFQTFDTHAAGSEALVSFMASLRAGTTVMVGALDDAQGNMSLAAKDALEACGATKIRDLTYRGSYALIGVKGGAAIAEQVLPEGVAIAEGKQVVGPPVPIFALPKTPVCNARSAEPPTVGHLDDGNLVLDAGCHYRLWEGPAAGACLENTWVVIMGSSNTLLEFQNLIQLLAPGEYNRTRPGEMVGASTMVDVVIKDGKVVHWANIPSRLPECRQVNKDEAALTDAACREALSETLSQAPAYDPKATRITMFLSFFWNRVDVAVDLLSREDTTWPDAEVAVVVQIGAWYNVCAVTKQEFCPRDELLKMDIDEAVQVFKDEMQVSVDKLQTFCSPGGRAGKRGCAVQTISWTHYNVDQANFEMMNGYIREAMAGKSSETLRLIDFYGLGGSMPEQVVMGHGSQMLNLLVWEIMLGGMCPADTASEGSFAVWHGNLCSGAQASYENCPKYYPSCKKLRCTRWECMNSVPCTLDAAEPPQRRRLEAPLLLDSAPPPSASEPLLL